ncbi:hypothetical protein TIFTF001_034311 [Ficus carica]|uniref:Disease resistance RPP13-like protein 1 n=1 Tax=Ficus carica TaxID=3494 RepID=A0AA88DZP9_FICCA|nr:hypothetical protein TIFTF001_034311 [Ficus carica]
MALELVGGAFLSSLFQTLFDKMASSEVLDFFRKKNLNPGLLKKLKILLNSADVVLDDAEGKQLGNPHVREWLLQLKEEIYAAEDLMIEICDECLPTDIECESSSRPRKVMGFTLPAFSETACEKEIEPKVQEIIETLKLLLEQKTHLGLEETSVHNGPYNSQRLLATSIVEESDVYGREDDKEKIIDLLLSNDDSGNTVQVIPIVGMGGIGKTTLAGLVYNNDRVSKSFDVKAWVTVSDNFDALRITRTILQNVEKSGSQAHDSKDLNQLQEALKIALNGQKFFFVLDDVWNKKYNLWGDFMRAFETGARGSKLVVTTRDEKIASMVAPNVRPHQLGELSDEECRKLLAKHVFCNRSPSAYPNMEVISRKIVERCKGLPLAVISLAGLLRAQPDPKEWERILHADIWEMPNNGDVEILPSLWLSYHYLPPHLKRCFAYCSIFPHDYEFSKEELILLWRAENILAIQKGQSPQETGEDYFNDLVARSLFRRTPGLIYVMHDLVSDLAKFVSAEFCLSWDEYNSNTSKSKARHLFVSTKISDIKEFEALTQAKYWRTLLAPKWGMKSSLLSVAQSLRVLSLRGYPYPDLPDSIGDLKHLRYLNLSSSQIKSLPDTVCNLHNLQILLLSYCRLLTRLPNKIGRLINLLHLEVRMTPLVDMPDDLYKLKSLQFLPKFVVGENNGSSINQLQKLLHLYGTICISGLENIVGVGDIAETILKDLKFVRELIFRWNGRSENSDLELERVALERLLPHTDLRILKIQGYRGTRFVDWLGDSSFSNVTSISLEGCRRCRLLPPLGQLPSLEELKISEFDELERIGDEFFSSSTSSTIVPFRSLKKLNIEGMRSWKEWSLTRAYGEAGVLPSLTHLRIWKCERLVSLLPGEPQQQTHTPFPSLETIYVSLCPMLETFLEWGSFSRLQSIRIWGCEMLFALRRSWDLQRCTSLTSLELRYCFDSSVGSFPEEGLLPTTLTSLSIIGFEYLKSLNGRSLQQLTSLESLFICHCEQLRCLPEERLPPSLSFLRIHNCPLLERRCQRENGEDWHKIDHITRVEIRGEYIML